MFFYVPPGGGRQSWLSKCKRAFSTGDIRDKKRKKKKKMKSEWALRSAAEIDVQLFAATAQLL